MEPSDYAAWIALGLSVVSIVWQWISWRLNGAWLKINAEVKPVWTGNLRVEMLCIEVRNSGRSATEVHTVDFPRSTGFRELAPKAAVFPKDVLGRVPFPRKLEPGGFESFKVSTENLAMYCQQLDWEPSEFRFRIRTGHKDYVERFPEQLVRQLEDRVREMNARESMAKQDGEAPRGKS